MNAYPIGVVRTIGRPEGQLEELGSWKRIPGGETVDRFRQGSSFPCYIGENGFEVGTVPGCTIRWLKACREAVGRYRRWRTTPLAGAIVKKRGSPTCVRKAYETGDPCKLSGELHGRG